MTRVIHTGDTHVGYQQYHSPVRREDFRRAFQAVVDDAVEADVDAVVHAGDLFHDRRPDLPDLMAVLSALRTLQDADIPFLAIVGNHEATRSGEWLDLFAEMGLATRLGTDPVEVGNTAFYGLDWVPRSRRGDLDYEFTESDCAHTALVAHGLFTPFQHGEWDTEEILERSNVAFGAVLLGDNHKPDTAEVDGAWVTYCGSTERASASEREPRGYNLVTFDSDAATDADPKAGIDVRRRAIETREFVFVSVELADGEGVGRVREQVRQHDLTDAVCIVEIDGEGDPVTPATIEETATEEGALVVRVTDRREVDEESEIQVTFADPDDAVRERIGELGLSQAAREIDETVRASKTADSKVREAVKARVTELVGEGPGAFKPAEDDSNDGSRSDATASDETIADATVTDEVESSETASGETGSENTVPTNGSVGDSTETAVTSEATDSDDAVDSNDDSNDSDDAVDSDDDLNDSDDAADSDDASVNSSEPTTPAPGGQGTMEDYL